MKSLEKSVSFYSVGNGASEQEGEGRGSRVGTERNAASPCPTQF